MTKLLLATGNQGKVKDLESMLKGHDFEVMSLADFPELDEVVEDGDTFLANAMKKAREIHAILKIPTLADDSGLEVMALDGRPGVYSARYGGEPSNDGRNVEKVLGEMADLTKPEQRKARFRCVLVYIDSKNNEHVTTGDCDGYLATEPRGENGFGYDPLFVHEKFNPKTMAEVSRDEKNWVSHRGKAFKAMLDIIKADARQ